jgi:hypothetical protein
LKGSAEPETDVPGESEGVEVNKVVNAPCEGVIQNHVHIGDMVKKVRWLHRLKNMTSTHKSAELFAELLKMEPLSGKGLKFLKLIRSDAGAVLPSFSAVQGYCRGCVEAFCI